MVSKFGCARSFGEFQIERPEQVIDFGNDGHADNIRLPGVGEVTAKNSWQNMGLWKIF
jgi:hypothetical protein